MYSLFFTNVLISIEDAGNMVNACIITERPVKDKPSAERIAFKVGLAAN